MPVRIEKDGPVWTVIHDRPEARNAMDPASADALTAAFLEFDANNDASVAGHSALQVFSSSAKRAVTVANETGK